MKIIDAMFNCPNEELFNPDASVSLGLGTSLTSEDIEKVETAAEKTIINWEKAVGDCFDEGYFEAFFKHGGGVKYHSLSATNQVSYEVESSELVENTDLGQLVKVSLKNGDKTEEVEVHFTINEDNDLIRSVEIR